MGSPGTYHMIVTNSGPHEATGPFVVTDVLPANLNYSSSSGSGCLVEYEIEVRNQGVGQPDADQLEVVDQIPDGSFLVVDDFGSPGSGPVNFVDGLVSSGLSYTFSGLNSTTDDVAFSDDHGLSFGYQPTIGVDGNRPRSPLTSSQNRVDLPGSCWSGPRPWGRQP